MHTCFGRGVEECFWLILMLIAIVNEQQVCMCKITLVFVYSQ